MKEKTNLELTHYEAEVLLKALNEYHTQTCLCKYLTNSEHDFASDEEAVACSKILLALFSNDKDTAEMGGVIIEDFNRMSCLTIWGREPPNVVITLHKNIYSI